MSKDISPRGSALVVLTVLVIFMSLPRHARSQTTTAGGADVSGVVLDLAGKPLAGANVRLLTDGVLVDLQQQGKADAPTTTSGTDGGFTLPRPKRAATVVVMSDAGYALAATEGIKAPLQLKLTPWGKIEGSLMIGERPAGAGAEIAADYRASNSAGLTVSFIFKASTDGQGRFAFNRLFAGKYKVFRRTPSGNGHDIPASVKPGEAVAVALTATGRPVTCRLALPDKLRDRKDLALMFERLDTPRQLARMALPADALKMTPAERFAWVQGWLKSPEGEQLAAAHAIREKLPSVQESEVIAGSAGFQIAELGSGTYHLFVRVHAQGGAGSPFDDENHVANLAYQFTVPPIPGGASEEVLDLGTLPVRPYGTLDSGQPAPDFLYQTLDGDEHLFSESRGKVVLLDFWGTWCGPCVAAMPALKEIQSKFGQRPDFKLLGMNVGDEPAKVKDFVRKREITWPQAMLGPEDGEQQWPVQLYSVFTYPVYVVIGRDGNVVFYGQSHHGLAEVIAAALGSLRP